MWMSLPILGWKAKGGNSVTRAWWSLQLGRRAERRGKNPWWFRRERICLQCGRPRFNPQVGKMPWRRERQPAPAFLPREFLGQRSLAGYSPWGRKESEMTEQLTPHLCSLAIPLPALLTAWAQAEARGPRWRLHRGQSPEAQGRTDGRLDMQAENNPQGRQAWVVTGKRGASLQGWVRGQVSNNPPESYPPGCQSGRGNEGRGGSMQQHRLSSLTLAGYTVGA